MAINYGKLDIAVSEAVFSWNVPYAAVVHEGATQKNGGIIPARPWTKAAIAEFDFDGTMQALTNAYGGDIDKAFKETCMILGQKFTQQISAPIWNWTDGGTRDIVDTGALRASQQLEFR